MQYLATIAFHRDGFYSAGLERMTVDGNDGEVVSGTTAQCVFQAEEWVNG